MPPEKGFDFFRRLRTAELCEAFWTRMLRPRFSLETEILPQGGFTPPEDVKSQRGSPRTQARRAGCDIDKPRNLAKSVTVE